MIATRIKNKEEKAKKEAETKKQIDAFNGVKQEL